MPGERSQRREALIGGAVVLTLTLAFLLIFFLADLRRLFLRTDDLYVLMPSAAGLKNGSVVWVAGRAVGEVKDIEVRPPDVDSMHRVAVHIEVEHRHLEHIRQDSEGRVTSFRMIGDAVLDISPGSPGQPVVEAGDTLQLRTVGTPAAAIARARSLNASLQLLLRESQIVRQHARARSAQAARLRDQLVRTGREFRDFSLALQEGPLNTLSDPEFNRIMSQMGAAIGELKQAFTRAADRARAARSDAEPALRRLVARADTISAAIAQLQAAMSAGGGGLLVRAQTDTAIVKALHGAQLQLDSLIAETKRNPARFWF